MVQQENRRTLMKGLAVGTGLAALGATGASASNGKKSKKNGDGGNNNVTAYAEFYVGEDDITWDESGNQGSENAQLFCPNGEGFWHWVLTGGGGRFDSATLKVNFSDGEKETAEGDIVGNGNVVHFDIQREMPDDESVTVESATAHYEISNPRGNIVLTISESLCIDGMQPPLAPKKRKKRLKRTVKRKKRQYKKAEKEYDRAKKRFKKFKKNNETND